MIEIAALELDESVVGLRARGTLHVTRFDHRLKACLGELGGQVEVMPDGREVTKVDEGNACSPDVVRRPSEIERFLEPSLCLIERAEVGMRNPDIDQRRDDLAIVFG